MVESKVLLTPEELERFERLSAEADAIASERATLRLMIGMHLSWEIPDCRWLDEARGARIWELDSAGAETRASVEYATAR